jgi:predicted nucleic acid-binding OB-fold protein
MYTHTHIHLGVYHSSFEGGGYNDTYTAKQSVPKNTDNTKKDPEGTVDTKPGLTSSVILAGKNIEFKDMVNMSKEEVDKILDGMTDAQERAYIAYKTQI